MPTLRFTLLGESTSDDALVRIVQLTLEQPAFGLLRRADVSSRFVSPLAFPRTYDLLGRIVAAAEDFPCDLLFVHRDADGPTHRARTEDLLATVEPEQHRLPPIIPVVPVREMEAWLLVYEAAICRAAGAHQPSRPLGLPRPHEVEACPDPKLVLRQALERVHSGAGRHQKKMRRLRPLDIAAHVEDIGPLRRLTAFRVFEAEVQRVIRGQGWPDRLPG